MSLAQTHSVALLGLDGHLVSVEVDIANGLPMYALLGLPDAALPKSRARAGGDGNCGEISQPKVTVSLSLRGYLRGSGLPLRHCAVIGPRNHGTRSTHDLVFLGELSLMAESVQCGSLTGTMPPLNQASSQLNHLPTLPATLMGNGIIATSFKNVLRWLRTGERDIVQEIEYE